MKKNNQSQYLTYTKQVEKRKVRTRERERKGERKEKKKRKEKKEKGKKIKIHIIHTLTHLPWTAEPLDDGAGGAGAKVH